MHEIQKITSFFSQFSERFLWWVGIISAMVIGLCIAIFFLFFQVREIELDRDPLETNIRYGLILQVMEYARNYNTLLLSTDSLEKLLVQRYKEIGTVSISKKLPDTLNISVEPDEILVKWVYAYQSKEHQFSGYLTQKNIFLEFNPQQKEVITIFDIQPRKKKIEFYATVSSGENVEKILKIQKKLSDVIIREITAIHYLRDAQEVHFIDEKGITYWIYLPKDTDKQIEKLAIMLKNYNIFAKNPEYIDLRIQKKVIYK